MKGGMEGKEMMNKFLQAAFVGVFLFVSVPAAAAGLDPKNVGEILRTKDIGPFLHAVQTATAAVTVGRRGALMNADIDDYTRITWTSSIGAMPYPTRVNIEAYDASAGNVVACTQAVVRGVDQYGRSVSETVSGIDESPSYTDHVYEKVESIALTGCTKTGTSDTNDRIQALTTDNVGLLYPIASQADVIAVCGMTGQPASLANLSVQEHCYDPPAGAINTLRGWIDLGMADGSTESDGGNLGVNNQTIRIRLRGGVRVPDR